jgi:ethanolamine ammonia-lyase large subunit
MNDSIFLAFGAPNHIQSRLEFIYNDAKRVIYENLCTDFLSQFKSHAGNLFLNTQASNREDYLLKPFLGELFTEASLRSLDKFRQQHFSIPVIDRRLSVQIIVSEGLNPSAIEAPGHLSPFLEKMRLLLDPIAHVNDNLIFVNNGRVRAGYLTGKIIFGKSGDHVNMGCIMHCIGERPGNGQQTFSVYISLVSRNDWSHGVDHNVVRVVCGISKLALQPEEAANRCLHFVQLMLEEKLQ